MRTSSCRCPFRNTAKLILVLGLSQVIATLTALAGPVLTARDVTIPAGRPFMMPLDGSGSSNGPLKFAVVSVSNTNLVTQFTATNNPSLRLNVSGVDAGGTNFTGDLVLELFPDLAPHTTARIIDLVSSNFYNSTVGRTMTFHRVVQGFMAQGGDPNGDGSGGSGVKFDDEFTWLLSFDGFGQLAMANSGPDSNDSQFFITQGDQPFDDGMRQSLDFSYTIFGQMTSGFAVLDKIMSTPVEPQPTSAEVSKPITPVVINTATIFTNRQATVLLLYTKPTFTGTATVTVRATDASKVSTQTTFHVTVVANNVQDKPFLGPVPNLVTTANTPAAFPFTYTDLSSVASHLLIWDAFYWDTLNTNVSPPNVTGNLSTNSPLYYTCTPASNFTGTASMVMALYGVLNQTVFQIDTQHFTLTVYPQALTLTLTKGTLQDSSKAHGDKVSIAGKLALVGQSGSMFNPTNDAFTVSIGDPRSPFTLPIPAGTPGWKASKGKFSWKSPKGFAAGNVSVQLDTVKGTFAITATAFDFPDVQSGLVHVTLVLGDNHGTAEQVWTPTGKTYGKFVLPKGP